MLDTCVGVDVGHQDVGIIRRSKSLSELFGMLMYRSFFASEFLPHPDMGPGIGWKNRLPDRARFTGVRHDSIARRP